MKLEVLFSESPAAVKLHFTKQEKKEFGHVADMCEAINKWMRPRDTELADDAQKAAECLTNIVDSVMDGVTEPESMKGCESDA
jgi:hypothetical protein